MNAATLRLAIGGPNAFTRWSFIVWLSVGILLSTFAGMRFGYTLPALLPVVLGVHLLLIPPLLVCRAIMIRASVKAPRPWLGLGMFAFLGGLRTLLPVIVAPAFGVTLSLDGDGFALPYLPSGMASAIVILGVVAVVVDGSRRNRAIVENLSALDAEFERARAFDEAELVDLEAWSVDQISRILEEELRQVQSEFGNAPDQAATRIRMLATDIARPLSHALAQGYELVPEADVVSAKPPRLERIRETIAQVRPAQPLVPFLLIELIAVSAVFAEPVGGVGFAALVMLLLGGIVFASSWVLVRLWPSGRTTVLRLIALVMLYALIGFVATWVRTVIIEWHTGIYNPLWITPFLLIVISMGVTFTTAIQTRQLDDRNRLAMSVARNAQLNAQVRERTRRAQRRIAKLLHSNVQAELIASAKLLASRSNEAADAASEHIDVAQEMHRLTSAIRDRLVPSMEPAVPAKERVLDLTSLWSGILDVKLVADGEAWTALEQDPEALDGVIDVIAEGLTNAVRHGNGSQVAIGIKNDVNEITVLLTSSGFLPQSTHPGFGSEILTEATSKWALAADGDQITLTSHIPYLPARI